jgi:hypothetical protein
MAAAGGGWMDWLGEGCPSVWSCGARRVLESALAAALGVLRGLGSQTGNTNGHRMAMGTFWSAAAGDRDEGQGHRGASGDAAARRAHTESGHARRTAHMTAPVQETLTQTAPPAPCRRGPWQQTGTRSACRVSPSQLWRASVHQGRAGGTRLDLLTWRPRQPAPPAAVPLQLICTRTQGTRA